MKDLFRDVLRYLKSEKIYIDEGEFQFQIKSHPDYPSVLSISDTLTFFDVSNLAFRVNFDDINTLPDRFLALFLNDENSPQFYFLTKNGTGFDTFFGKGKEFVTKESLERTWIGIVLLAESDKENPDKERPLSNNLITKFSLFLSCILSIYMIIETPITMMQKLFIILPVIGIILSGSALKDIFGSNEFVDGFCTRNAFNCESIIKSEKWKLFKKVDFSDLSFLFFTSQLVSILIFVSLGKTNFIFFIQNILLWGSIPFIAVSLFYQKFIEKQWCPICLLISLILIAELIITLGFSNVANMSLLNLIILCLVYILLFGIWRILKPILAENQKLRETNHKNNRFIRNFENFQRNLTAQSQISFPSSEIILGNPNAVLEILLVTSPFCKYCKDVHSSINEILEKYSDKLKVRVVIKVEIDNETTTNREFIMSLIEVYHVKGEMAFRKSLDEYFKDYDILSWLDTYKNLYNDRAITILNSDSSWAISQGINYTPALFINGFEFPKTYPKDSLIHFIPELLASENTLVLA